MVEFCAGVDSQNGALVSVNRDKKVIKKNIAVGDWVLKRKPNAEGVGKLQSKWDGPFLVIKSSRPDSYHLSDSEGNELQHTWNADSLKKYYV